MTTPTDKLTDATFLVWGPYNVPKSRLTDEYIHALELSRQEGREVIPIETIDDLESSIEGDGMIVRRDGSEATYRWFRSRFTQDLVAATTGSLSSKGPARHLPKRVS